MANYPPPLNLRIRVEGLESFDDKSIEIFYEINSNFALHDIFNDFKKRWQKFRDITNFFPEVNLIENKPQLQIIENENREHGNKNIENKPFIADSFNLKVSWESDRYVMRNQGVKVIELFQNKNYVMIINKRSKNIL